MAATNEKDLTMNSEAMTLSEYLEFNHLDAEDFSYKIRKFTPAEGEQFWAVGLDTGLEVCDVDDERPNDHRPAYQWFRLSREEAKTTIIKTADDFDNWLETHAANLRFLKGEDFRDPETGEKNPAKFGCVFFVQTKKWKFAIS